MFFAFPDDARWNPERRAVKIGEYQGAVRMPRRGLQRPLSERSTPERCVETYYPQRIRLELITGRKLRQSQLTNNGNVRSGAAILRGALAPLRVNGPINSFALLLCLAMLLAGCEHYHGDASAGPNPGGGFYGGPNLNVGRIDPARY
jgi:hypothetical protein